MRDRRKKISVTQREQIDRREDKRHRKGHPRSMEDKRDAMHIGGEGTGWKTDGTAGKMFVTLKKTGD
jgi:hypothetical protein